MPPATRVECAAGCGKGGTLKCSACSQVTYCSSECQKKDWKEHKRVCQKRATSPGRGGGIVPLSQQQQQSHQLTHKQAWEKCRDFHKGMDVASSKRDLAAVVKVGGDAVKFASGLPEPMASFEIVRFYVSISQAMQQGGNMKGALETTKQCVERAEKIYTFDRQGKHSDGKQSSEVLMSAYLSRAHMLLDSTTNKQRDSGDVVDALKEAATRASKALELCDSLFSEDSGNIARFKPRRVLALIKERQESFSEALTFARGAYDEVLRAYAKGPPMGSPSPSPSPELLWLDLQQLLVDELTGILMRQKEAIKAEALAVSDFKHLTKTRKISKNHPVYADGLNRLAQVRMQLPDKRQQADEDMTACFKIREKLFDGVNDKDERRLILADSAVMLTKIRESRGIINEESEVLLKRAAKIYASCGQSIRSGTLKTPFNFHLSIDADLTRLQVTLRNKNNNCRSSVDDVESDDDAEGVNLTESKVKTVTTSSNRINSTGLGLAQEKKEAPKYTFQPDDGYSRMQAASTLFEEEHFSAAVVILQEAVDIFIKKKGPNDPLTVNARQNLALATNKELNMLWRECITSM